MRNTSVRAVLAVAAIAFLGAAQSSQAAVIDFTKASDWAGVAGQWQFTSGTLFDGVTVQVTSQGPGSLLTFNNGGDVNASCAGVTGLACQGDGLGINDDEVTKGSSLVDPTLERLYVYFNKPVNVTQIGFLDLFGINTLVGDVAPEMAMWVAFNGGGFIDGSLVGTDTTTTLGYKTINTSYTGVTALMFYATTPPASANTDFAVAKLNITAPEPATLLLTVIGIVATTAFRRRRAA